MNEIKVGDLVVWYTPADEDCSCPKTQTEHTHVGITFIEDSMLFVYWDDGEVVDLEFMEFEIVKKEQALKPPKKNTFQKLLIVR